MPAGAGCETSPATSEVEEVFKVFVMSTKGEMVRDGLAEVALAGLALWWLVCSEAGVDVRGARICREG